MVFWSLSVTDKDGLDGLCMSLNLGRVCAVRTNNAWMLDWLQLFKDLNQSTWVYTCEVQIKSSHIVL